MIRTETSAGPARVSVAQHGKQRRRSITDTIRERCFSARFVQCFFLGVALLAAGPGCTTSASARKVVALDRFQRIYVETRLNENHHLDELFVRELRRLGREASSGPLTMMPEKTDAVLTYDARWEWDFKNYLIELTFELHTIHPRKKIADARYHQPTIRTKPPEEIIRELFGRLFTKA